MIYSDMSLINVLREVLFFRYLDEEGVEGLLENKNLNVQQATEEILNVSNVFTYVQRSGVAILFFICFQFYPFKCF